MTLQKGKFYNADTNAEVVTCQFNPTELKISRTNKWTSSPTAGSKVGDLTFGGTDPQSLSLSLMFDSYETRTDVRLKTKLLLGLMDMPADAQSRPPHVEFGWGTYRSFRGVISSYSETFTLFLESGIPVRAKVDVKLDEVPKVAATARSSGQNPTSRMVGARRVRTVQPGDTIDLIAYEELGDAGKWRLLADSNQIEDPRRLVPGFHIYIPSDN